MKTRISKLMLMAIMILGIIAINKTSTAQEQETQNKDHWFYQDVVSMTLCQTNTIFCAVGKADMQNVLPELIQIMKEKGFYVTETEGQPKIVAVYFPNPTDHTGNSIRVHTEKSYLSMTDNPDEVVFEMMYKKLDDITPLTDAEKEFYNQQTSELIKEFQEVFKKYKQD